MPILDATLAAWLAVATLAAWAATRLGGGLITTLRAHWVIAGQRWPVVYMLRFKTGPRKGAGAHKLGVLDAREGGGVQVLRAGCLNVLQISDPWLISELLSDRAKYPDLIDKPSAWPFAFYKGFDQGTAEPPTPSLLSAQTSDPHWKAVRRGVSPAFAPAQLREAFPKVRETVLRLVKTLGRHGAAEPLDLSMALQCESFDVIGRVGFGRDFRAADDLGGRGAAACKAIKDGCELVMGGFLNPLRRLDQISKVARQRRRTRAHILDTMRELLQEVEGRRAQPCDLEPPWGVPNAEDASIAAQLMRLGKAGGLGDAALPQLRLWSELSIMFLAGMETTGNSICLALYLIATHPEVEAKLVAELDAAGLLVTLDRPHPRELAQQDFKDLPYLDAVLKECQRLKPVIPMVLRQAVQDLQAGPFHIPKGTTILLHIMAMQQSPFFWERCTEFWPERWLQERTEDAVALSPEQLPANFDAKRHFRGCDSPECLDRVGSSSTKRFLPFGDGPRKCVGYALAKVNYTTAVAVLLSHFSFRLADKMGGVEGMERSEACLITLQHKHGCFMHCIPRNSSREGDLTQ